MGEEVKGRSVRLASRAGDARGAAGIGKDDHGRQARSLPEAGKRNPYLVPADVRRPAAIEQLRLLGEQVGCAVHPSRADQNPDDLSRGAVAAGNQGYDVCLFDTAGGSTSTKSSCRSSPTSARGLSHEIVLVADAMTGQDAVNVARASRALTSAV
jgi:signal recognition particle subunit SRP54